MADLDDNYQSTRSNNNPEDKLEMSEEMKARITAEQAKYDSMPPLYIRFTIRFRCFWILLNIFNIVTSVLMGMGTVLILSGGGKGQDCEGLTGDEYTECLADQLADKADVSYNYPECENMTVVCWALFTLHVINCIFSLMALCSLEKRICISHVLLALVIYDVVILVWAQVVYFKAQSFNCNI